MPMEYEFDERRGLVYIRGTGYVSAQDVGERERALLAEPWYAHALARLIDLREVEDFPPAPEIARYAATAGQAPPSGHPSRRAVLVATDMQYGLARMVIGHFHSPLLIYEIFRGESEALAWLGIAAEVPERGAALDT